MEIRLLGRFDVVHEGAAVQLGGPRQRAVLAVLAVHANEIVSLDRLADEVWGGEPPNTAVVTLQRYISHLRRALEDLPVAIETRRPGYVLVVDPDVIDARRFERLVDEGRRHLSSGEVEQAAKVLRDALGMWQGDPLADFRYEPFARIETTRLEELRSTAVELRIDADLALGRHRDLVPELEALVAANPLRESYRGQLMRALHGSGRRAEALRVYTEGRNLLAEELGLDPSTSLQRLEQAILLRDPEVEPPAPSPVPAVPPAAGAARSTGRLPAELTSFVGRSHEVQAIIDLLEQARLVTLTGVGGSGKSRLALKVATMTAPSYPGGAWLVELGGVNDPAVVARAVAHVLGVREEPDRPLVEVITAYLRQQSALIVMDGCEHLLDTVAPLVEEVLAGAPEVRVLATSREILDVPGETAFRVPTLSVPAPGDMVTGLDDLDRFDGVRLFVERARAVDAGFRPTEADLATIVDVCRRLDGLPLALELAAARTDVLTLRQLAERLDDRFELLTGGRRTALPRHRTLRATIAWSYDLLGPSERLLFDRLSVFAGSFTVDTAEAVCAHLGLEQAEVFHLLAGLVRKSLVVRVPTTAATARYRLLDTVRDYGRERLRERGERAAMHQRHAAVFTETMERLAPALDGPGAEHILDELDVEHDEFRAALAWLFDEGDADGACRLAAALGFFWNDRYYMQDAVMWLERVLALARAAGLPPTPAHISATIWLGFFRLELDEFAATRQLLDRSMEMLREAPDDFAESRVLRVQAELARYDNDLALAQALVTRAAELSRRQDDLWGQADANRLLAILAMDRGDLAAFSAAASECLRLFEISGKTERIAGAQVLLGTAAYERGDYETAQRLFEDSVGRFQQINEPMGIGIALWYLAVAANTQGEHDQSLRFATETLRVNQEIEFARGIGRAYQALAEAQLARGEIDAAEAACAQALELLRERGFIGDLVLGLRAATRVAVARGRLDEALGHVDEALSCARRSGYGRYIGQLLHLRANVLVRMGDLAAARADALEAMEEFDRAGNSHGRATALVTMAAAAVSAGRAEEARDHLRAAEEALAESGTRFARTEEAVFLQVAEGCCYTPSS